jgi:hypothetical protein
MNPVPKSTKLLDVRRQLSFDPRHFVLGKAMRFAFHQRSLGAIQVQDYLTVSSDHVDVLRTMIGRVDDDTV